MPKTEVAAAILQSKEQRTGRTPLVAPEPVGEIPILSDERQLNAPALIQIGPLDV